MLTIPVHHYPDLRTLPTKILYQLFILISIIMAVVAFFFNTPLEIWDGFWLIMRSPANLLTDYMALANPGATLINASIMTLQALVVVRICNAKINGPVIAALFLIIGFSFFGKNFYNSMPIVLGSLYYAKVTRNPLEKSLLAALFGTALGPLVSELSFNEGFPLVIGVSMGYLAGFIVGFILPPLSRHVITFTKGFSLYNVGFTSGFLGTLVISLMRSFGMTVENSLLISSLYTRHFTLLLITFFTAIFIFGFLINNKNFKGIKDIHEQTGQLSTDFIDVGGIGATFMNMGMLGIFSTLYVLALGGDLSGPVIGGILSVVGFGAFGKTLLTATPVMIGATIMSHLTLHDTQTAPILIAILFATTLSPIAGRYGAIVGMIAGALHLAMVTNVGFLYGGVNLYNNGFAGGLIAAMMVPILEAIHVHRVARLNPDRPELDPAEEIERLEAGE